MEAIFTYLLDDMIQSVRENSVNVTRTKYEQLKRFIRLHEADISKLLDEDHKFSHNTFYFILFYFLLTHPSVCNTN